MWTEALRGKRAAMGGSASTQAATRVNAEQASKRPMRRPTRRLVGEGCQRPETPPKIVANEHKPVASAGVVAAACVQEERRSNTGSPVGGAHASTGNPRGPAWADRVAERLVVPGKPGNAGGGKEPQVERNVRKGTGTQETGASLQAPVTVRQLQRAWHAKAKGAPGCREERERGALAEAVEAVAPVAEPEAPGEVGEGRALPGWTTVCCFAHSFVGSGSHWAGGRLLPERNDPGQASLRIDARRAS